MPGTFLNFPFDEEIFLMNWSAAQDPTRTAMIESGAVARNREIERLIAAGSNVYTIPFYKTLGGTPDNYDGATAITITDPEGGYQRGVVYGRAHAWKDHDFIHEFNSGANPTLQITNQVAKYWQKKRQARLIGILAGIFAISDDSTDAWDAWQLHTLQLARTTDGTVTDANKVDATSAGDAMQRAVGDNSGIFRLALMHSVVANALAKQQLLNYRKYTDIMGIERKLAIADWNDLTVVVDDSMPYATNETTGEVDYTTYLLGEGAVQFGSAPVARPVETDRASLAEGGYDYLITRFRETLHPNGFSYTIPTTSPATISPTDVQLAAEANWALAGVDAKSIAIARIISNG